MALDQAVVEKYIAQAAETSSAKAPNKLAKALKKMSGSIAVAIGYHFDPARAPRPILNLMTNTLEGSDAKADLRLYSMLMRKEKAAALFMDCSTEQGLEDLAEVAREQTTARGGFPGPLPVVRSGPVDSVRHLAEARAAGADGAVIDAGRAGAAELVRACAALGMEAVARVETAEQAAAAAAAGAGILLCAGPAAAALRAAVPSGTVAAAALDCRAHGGPDGLQDGPEDQEPAVLRDGTALREARFDGVVALGACAHTRSKEEMRYARWLLEQLQSKKSASFAHLAKGAGMLGAGRPPVQAEGFHTRLE